jgi:hypothetical protein
VKIALLSGTLLLPECELHDDRWKNGMSLNSSQ